MAFHLIFSRGWHSSVHSSCNHRMRARQNEKRVSGTAGWAAYSFVIWFARLRVSDVPIYTVCRLRVIVGIARPEDIFTRLSSAQSSPLCSALCQFWKRNFTALSLERHHPLSPINKQSSRPLRRHWWLQWSWWGVDATGPPGNQATGQLGSSANG